MATRSAGATTDRTGQRPGPEPRGLRHRAACARPELLGALTAVSILAPASVAFAQLAGLPPTQGLVAAPLAGLVYALLGGARTLYVAPLAATALLTAVTVAGLAGDPRQRMAAGAAMALLAGGILLVTGVARCGFIVHFLRPEAMTGFLFGLGVVVVVRELGTAAGSDLGSGTALERLVRLVGDVPHWNPASTGLAALAFVLLLALERWLPAVPATLVVLVVAAAAAALGRLDEHGIAVIGRIPDALPTAALPDLTAGQWTGLVGGASGLALVTFVLSYGVATRLAGDETHRLDANREMLALGAANLVAGAGGGMGSAGSPESSLAAHAVGARRRWGTVVGTVLLFLLSGYGGAVFTWLPEAALAAVVIAAVRGFLAPRPFVVAWRRDRAGFAVAACALAGVVGVGLLQGLLVAVALSLLLVVASASRLHVSELARRPGTGVYLALERFPDLRRDPGFHILRPDGQLFFANAERVADHVEHHLATAPLPKPATILLDLGASFHLDPPTVQALCRLRERLSERGVGLRFLHLYLAAADAIAASPLADVPAHREVDDAVRTALAGIAASGKCGSARRPVPARMEP
jgi:sulfate permease, SulP family